jgi:membrane-bound inhibitor of C-type lysozyme
MLHQRPAASGIWYAGDSVTLRGKGREATLARGSEPIVSVSCRHRARPPV